MGNPPGYHEGVGSIGIEGYRILALALMSQGAMTAPRSLFVAVKWNAEEDVQAICAMWSHADDAFFNSSYFYGDRAKAVADAYEAFVHMLEEDVKWYLSKGVPLTTMMPGDEDD